MMKQTLLYVLVVCLLCPGYTNAQKNKTAAKKIDSLFAAYNTQTPGVAVAVVKDGKIVFKKGYGMANLEHHIPVTPQTVFNIASVSKQFTAFAIYLLESEGKISLEDDVRKYIPELPDYGNIIKIKHLLAHTSGLRDHGALASIAGSYINNDLSTTAQNLKLLSGQKGLNFIPGSSFGYCNSNFTLLAEIAHRVTGKTFSEYTTEKIFKPLGMNNTWFCDNHEAVVKNKAASYVMQNNKYYISSLTESNPGPSNLLTTVEDLCKWVLNFEKPVVGNHQLLKAFNEPSYLNNGEKVVLRIIDGDSIFHAKGQNLWKHKGDSIISHGGHTAGFRTFLGRFPGRRLSIIQLSNDEHNERFGGRWDIADYYINNQVMEKKQTNTTPPRNPAPVPIENYIIDLNEFAGKYYNDELETGYRFEVVNKQLVMKHFRLYDMVLKRTGEYKFSGSGPATFAFEMEFLSNQAGAVTAFTISNFGVKNLQFVKQQ